MFGEVADDASKAIVDKMEQHGDKVHGDGRVNGKITIESAGETRD